MSLIVESGGKNSHRKFDLPSEGAHPATLIQVKNLGEVETKFGPKPRVRFIWELQDEKDSKGWPLRAFQAFNLSFDPKSFLYKAVRQILGSNPPSRFDLETLVGTQATVVIEHNEGSEGQVFANVSAIIRWQREGVRP